MHDERSHLLAQVPLTVSPFITLPKAPTLPHNYTTLPSTLPPSCITGDNPGSTPAAYVTSSSGFAAHPSSIITQNRALAQQLRSAATDAEAKIRDWETGIRQRELAEKRRKAPGWLDRDEKILQPDREALHGRVEASGSGAAGRGVQTEERDLLGDGIGEGEVGVASLSLTQGHGDQVRPVADLGAQMDRAFGDGHIG